MMKRIRSLLVVILAAGLCWAPSLALAERPLPTLSISGVGMAAGTPDEATLTLGVVTHAETCEAAQKENRAAAQAIRAAIMDLGIDRRDIQTQHYSFHPEYRREKDAAPEIVGYMVSNTVLVRVADVEAVGRVIDAALANGANTVDALDFSIRDTDALRRMALAAAVKDAREKADILAGALGRRIAGIQSVTEDTRMFQPRLPMNKMAMSEMATDRTPIEAGTLSLEAAVHIDFILAD